MTYLPWAGSLDSDSAGISPDSPGPPDRAIDSDSHEDPAGHLGPSTPSGPPSIPRPADPDGLGGRTWPGYHSDSAAPAEAAALAQVISHRLFSAGLDLHFVMMARRDGPCTPRLEHAIAEIDDALKDLRHLMLAITQRLA
jgi:hypothetical protein